MVHIKKRYWKNKWTSLRIFFWLSHPTERVSPSMLPKRLKCFYSYIRQRLQRGSKGQPWKMFINKATTSGLSCPSHPPGFTSPCQCWLWGNIHHQPEKAMAPHSSTLPWKIPWTEEPGGLQSMGSLRVRHDWATSLSLFIFMHWRRKWQPTPVFSPGESQGRGNLVGCRLWGRIESAMTKATQQQQQQHTPPTAKTTANLAEGAGHHEVDESDPEDLLQSHPEPLRNGDLWTTEEEKLSKMRKKVASKRGRPRKERALQKTAEACILNETFMLKLKHLC